MTVKVLICGHGNGAHVLAALTAANANMEAYVFTLNESKAKIWSEALERMPLTCCNTDGNTEIHSKPTIVTHDASKVVADADIILITIPAFSHEMYFRAIEPHIKHSTIIVGLPGQPGFDFQSRNIFKRKLDLITILSCQTLPWACRIVEYGKRVNIRGTKNTARIATISSSKNTHSAIDLLQSVIGSQTILKPVKHYLELDLMCIVMHPGIMYHKWKDWDGRPLKEKPLFYHGVDDVQVECIHQLSQEVLHTAEALSKNIPGVDMSGCMSMFEWLVSSYGPAITDVSSSKSVLLTSTQYKTSVHPMVSLQEGFVPDFNNRYLSEDVPFGLVVIKGLAQIVGVETPVTDTVMTWAQGKLDKEYIVGKELTGRDLGETRAPQVYGITSLEHLATFINDI